MEKERALYHRDEFRVARVNASRDTEAYDEIIHALERLGSGLAPGKENLKDYEQKIIALCLNSPIAQEIPGEYKDWHIPVHRLYDVVRKARNDAFHQGAFARHLTNHAIELAIILEDALTAKVEAKLVGDFMVREPVCALLWQPLSYVRQQMLVSSFSCLPLRRADGKWCLISDVNAAKYLGRNYEERKRRLAQTVKAAIEDGLGVDEVTLIHANDPVDEVLSPSASSPALVCRRGNEAEIVGIITAYDLL